VSLRRQRLARELATGWRPIEGRTLEPRTPGRRSQSAISSSRRGHDGCPQTTGSFRNKLTANRGRRSVLMLTACSNETCRRLSRR
jgi:hypothetical protein